METMEMLKTSAFRIQPTSSFTFVNHQDQFGKKIWSIWMDLPGEKVNKLDRRVLGEFETILQELKRLSDAGEIEALVFFSKKEGNFIAGADIKLIEACTTAEQARTLSAQGHSLYNRWEDLPFPKIVAIDGSCLGGGCELSLASDAILMSTHPKAKIGLPEVMLGVIPGLGGCVRLPQRVGLAQALDLILNSKQLDGQRAFKAGLADACLQKENFSQEALRWTFLNLAKLRKGERLGRKPALGGMGGWIGSTLEGTPFGRNIIFNKAKSAVLSKTRGQYPAPLAAIEVLRKNGIGFGPKVRGRKREEACKREADAFGACAATPVSKNLIRIFFVTEDVKKHSGVTEGTNVVIPHIERAAVLGAGTMGGGIAQLFADKGIQVRMKDLNNKALELGLKAASDIFTKQLARKKINRRQYVQKMNLIAPVLDFSGFSGTQLVVEAIVEKMDIKKAVLADLEKNVTADCVLATNTSSLSVSEMQKALQKPGRFAGMHFFNPVHKMPLIEVIRGDQSSDTAVAAVFELSKKLGKIPVVVKDGAGFLVNRLLVPYLNEAMYLLSEGATVEQLDTALLNFGMPMGPMELIDEVGIDIGEHVLKILHQAFGERMQPCKVAQNIIAQGRLGRKTKKGMYLYEGRKKTLDPELYKLLGVTPNPKKFDETTITERCILPMVNEAARCLEEKVVAGPAEVDLAMIMGTGFPPFRGGLMRFADDYGPKNIIEKLEHHAKNLPPEQRARYQPSDALKKVASGAGKFYR